MSGRRPGTFQMDTRNVGGRQAVMEHMLQHQANLRNIQSSIPGAAAKRNSKKKKKKGPVRSKREYSFCDEPETYYLVNKLSAQRKAHKDRTEIEHKRRLDESNRRIHEYPTPGQRRQNQFDPVGHPALLVRYNPEKDGHSSVPEYDYAPPRDKELYYADPYQASHLVPLKNGPPPPRKIASPSRRGGASSTRPTRPSTSHGVGRAKASTRPRKNRPLSALGRRADNDGHPLLERNGAAAGGAQVEYSTQNDPYLKLKKHLFELIVEHRIFRQTDLNALFDKARGLNTHLDKQKVEQVISELQDELHVASDPPATQQEHAEADPTESDQKHEQ